MTHLDSSTGSSDSATSADTKPSAKPIVRMPTDVLTKLEGIMPTRGHIQFPVPDEGTFRNIGEITDRFEFLQGPAREQFIANLRLRLQI